MWQQIGNHNVFIVDRHHEVLPAWVKACRDYQVALPLITFDYHTDLRLMFGSYSSANGGVGVISREKLYQLANERLAEVDINDEDSVASAVADLRHDEHIDCAIKLGLISHAYVSLGWYEQKSDYPNATLFNYDPCVPGCTNENHGSESCAIRRADLVIDDSVLAPRLSEISKSIDLEIDPYILDIDIDVFSTCAAISPPSASEFHRLICNAAVITVAREKSCVEEYGIGGGCLEEGLTVEYLEAKLIGKIEV